MDQAEKLYEFSASVGALEGYVYHKEDVAQLDMKAMDVWTKNLTDAYDLLPDEILEKIQDALDKTLNRAISSLDRMLEPEHPVLSRLVSMTGQRKEVDPDDFQKKKWFQNQV